MRPDYVTNEALARWELTVPDECRDDPIRRELSLATEWLREEIGNPANFQDVAFAIGQRISAQSWASYRTPVGMAEHLIGRFDVGPYKMYMQIEELAIWKTADYVARRFKSGIVDTPGAELAAVLCVQYIDRTMALKDAMTEALRDKPIDLGAFKKSLSGQIEDLEPRKGKE